MARSAPPTAPKNEAAHARNGVSSHPKIRKTSRSQRMRSGAFRAQPREQRWPGRARAGTRPRTWPRVQPAPGKWISDGDHGARPPPQTSGSAERRRAARPRPTLDELVGEDPRTEPRQERAHHPPDRVIPPVAAAAEVQPAVSVRPDVLQQRDVDPAGRSRRRRARCRPRRRSPRCVRGRVHSPGRSVTAARPTSTITASTAVWSDAVRQEARDQRDHQHDDRLEQPELDRRRGRWREHPSGRGPRAVPPPSACRLRER